MPEFSLIVLGCLAQLADMPGKKCVDNERKFSMSLCSQGL